MRIKNLLLLCVVACASAEFYISGGLSLTGYNEEYDYSNSTTTLDIESGVTSPGFGLFTGYQSTRESSRESNLGYFFDAGLNVMPSEQEMVSADTDAVNVDIKTTSSYAYLLRAGSMFRASSNLFPFILGSLMFEPDYEVTLTEGSTTTEFTKDITSFGLGVGLRGYAGESGFYEFSYLYTSGGDLDIVSGTTNTFTINPQRSIFLAAIGRNF